MFNFLKKQHQGDSDRDLLLQIVANQHFIISKISIFMGQFEDFSAALNKIDTGITGVAAELQTLASNPQGGLTADQETSLLARIQAQADKLTALEVPAAPATPPATPAS